MTDKHLSTQFDAELSGISTRVLEMGGLVESQVAQAIYALTQLQRRDRRARCCSSEERVNQMEVEIDRDLSTIIARRQPTARDLRLLIAISKTIAQPRARRRRGRAHRAHGAAADQHRRVEPAAPAGGRPAPSRPSWPSRSCARRSTPSPGWTPTQALEVLKQDDQIDQEFDGLMRKLITYMMEDPRTISSSIDLVFVAKAIERVGDHAKNLAEQIIYIVKGTDVRHNSVDDGRERRALSAQGAGR